MKVIFGGNGDFVFISRTVTNVLDLYFFRNFVSLRDSGIGNEGNIGGRMGILFQER